MEIVNPVAERGAEAAKLAGVTISGSQRATVAFLNNGWEAMGLIADQMAKRLKEDHGVAGVIEEGTHMSRAAPSDVLDRVASEADFAIVGLGT